MTDEYIKGYNEGFERAAKICKRHVGRFVDMERRLLDAMAKLDATGGVSGYGLRYILDGSTPDKRSGFTAMRVITDTVDAENTGAAPNHISFRLEAK